MVDNAMMVFIFPYFNKIISYNIYLFNILIFNICIFSMGAKLVTTPRNRHLETRRLPTNRCRRLRVAVLRTPVVGTRYPIVWCTLNRRCTLQFTTLSVVRPTVGRRLLGCRVRSDRALNFEFFHASGHRNVL